MTQETKAKDCCYGVRPLSDCQCEKDRLSALAAEPSSLECQSEIDKDLVRTYYGDIGAFYRVRAALAATPAVGGEARGELTKIAAECHRAKWKFDLSEDYKPKSYAARGMILSAFDELHRIGDLAIKARDALAAPPASPLRGREPTDEQIGAAILKFARDQGREVNLTYDKGSYEVTTPTWLAREFASAILSLAASPPEQPATANNHAFTLNTPMTRFSNQRPVDEQSVATPFQPHENCNCLMCLAEKSR